MTAKLETSQDERFIQIEPVTDKAGRVHLLALDAKGFVWGFDPQASEWKLFSFVRNEDQSDAGWLD